MLNSTAQSCAEFIGNVNQLDLLDAYSIELGRTLEKAFHQKQDYRTLQSLVLSNKAPVNYRLSYGLEIQREADFVYCLYLLLGGDTQADINVTQLPERYRDILPYINTSKVFFETLYNPTVNLTPIPVHPEFRSFILDNALKYRSEPKDPDGSLTNGALIIAAGLRDYELMQKLIDIGKRSSLPLKLNGAHVDFEGYFDETAIAWSAILLDEKGFNLLLSNGASLENIGMMKSSVLHWIAAAIAIHPTKERCEIGIKMINASLSKGANPKHENIFRKTPAEYLPDSFTDIKALLNNSHCALTSK